MGKKEFDKIAGNDPTGFIATFLKRDMTSDETDWVLGDWGYIDDERKKPPAGEEGENIIYLGNDEWWGHPGGIKTLKEWKSEVGSWNGKKEAPVKNNRTYPKFGLLNEEE